MNLDLLNINTANVKMTYESKISTLQAKQIQQIHLYQNNKALSYAQVLDLWQNNAEFCSFFNQTLAQIPFTAFRWETPPLTSNSLDQIFACVLVNSPTLARPANPKAFTNQLALAPANERVLAFANLGGDAWLVVPTAQGPETAYPHLAAFVRQAPANQQVALWQKVGQLMKSQLGQQVIWLSTAGGGVPWLHVRLDSYPKYYAYAPYRLKT